MDKKHLLLMVLVCLSIFFVNLDAIYVNIMEARNFTTAREMLHDGNWLLTTLNGEPRYEKPPLPTWLTAFSGGIFGLNKIWALRLPAALITLILVLLTYKLGKKITDNKTYAFLGSLILATSFYIIFSGRNGQWDIFTHGFMMVCIYQLYLFFKTSERKYQYAVIAGLFFGLSFMSKGPVSLYALLLPFLIAFGIVYKYRNFKEKWLPLLLFLLISAVVSGWWHWYTYMFDTTAVTEITQKEASNWTGYNVRPFYYYWSFFTQSGVWTIPAFIGLLFPYLKDRVFNKKAYLFTFLWTILSVILLSLIPEKKSRYLLPVLIPLALNTAFYLEYLFRRFSTLKDKRETIPVFFNFGLIAVIGLLFPIAGYFFLRDQLAGNSVWFVLLSLSLFGIGLFIMQRLFQRKIQSVFYATIVFIISIMCFGMPLAKTLTVNPGYKGLSKLNDWQAESNLKVYEYESFTPELIWDYGKPIPMIVKDGKTTLPEEASFGVLVAEYYADRFKKTFSNYTIEKVTYYDMNPKSKEQGGFKDRLYRDLYVVSKR